MARPNYNRAPGYQYSSKQEKWACKACKSSFTYRSELVLHLQQMWLNSQSHVHCHVCAIVFDNDEEKSMHIRSEHPTEEKLICPSCRCGPFELPTTLMAHMKPECCPAYDLEAIIRFSAQSQASHSLDNSQWSATSQAHSYEKSKEWSSLEDKEVPLEDHTTWSQIKKARLTWKSSFNAWGENTAKVYNDGNSQPSVTKAAIPRLQAFKTATDLHDPDSVTFNADNYISVYSGRYTCPKTGCQKTFKPHECRKFKAHLRKHLDVKCYQCPSCCRRFSTTVGLITHMEQQQNGCKLQQNAGFGAWLLKVTGGIVKSISKTTDGKSIFETTINAQRELKSPLLPKLNVFE